MNLKAKTIAITGATGGLGKQIALEAARCGANLIFVNRSQNKSDSLEKEIKASFPLTKITTVIADLESPQSVNAALDKLLKFEIDYLILNAGIYNVPIKMLKCGYNNIFVVNFVSQYYIVRKLLENGSQIKKVIAIGSIAHAHKKFDETDIDYSGRRSQTKIYGNSKKFLMYSMETLKQLFPNTEFSIAHPGITHTSMTSHYPKAINWLVKFGVKVLFAPPQKACRSVFMALENESKSMEWFGPRFCDIYGKPTKKRLKHNANEVSKIMNAINVIYKNINKQLKNDPL